MEREVVGPLAVYRKFREQLKDIAQLAQLEQKIDEETVEMITYIGNAYTAYLDIFDFIANMGEKEIRIIKEAYAARAQAGGITRNSASAKNGADVLEVLAPVARQELSLIPQEGANPNSWLFAAALDNLAGRMEAANRYHEQNPDASLADKNEKTHDIIFGHLVGNPTPYALIHFLFTHFFARTFEEVLAGHSLPEVSQLSREKDTVINLMSDAIRIMHARGLVDEELYRVWTTIKPEGVQWLVSTDAQGEKVSGDHMEPFFEQAAKDADAKK